MFREIPIIKLWFIVCILVRAALTITVAYLPIKYLPYIGYFALIPALGFFIAMIVRPTGRETGNAPIWWNVIRPIHGILWCSFALAAILKCPYSWTILAIDTVLGLGAFLGRLTCYLKPIE